MTDTSRDLLVPGRRLVHLQQGECVIASVDLVNDRVTVHYFHSTESRRASGIWHRWITDEVSIRPSADERPTLTSSLPISGILEADDPCTWAILPERTEDEVEALRQRVLSEIVGGALTVDPDTLISENRRLVTTQGPQPGYYFHWVEFGDVDDIIDHVIHAVDFGAASLLRRTPVSSNAMKVYTRALGTSLWGHVYHHGLNRSIHNDIDRTLMYLVRNCIVRHDDDDAARAFAAQVMEAVEQRILRHFGANFQLERESISA